MNILATQYTMALQSLDIYVAGCKGHCKNCHNPESWDFSQGSPYGKNLEITIEEKIKSFDNLIKNIMIFGGEPLDQPQEELIKLLVFLNQFNKDIWLFTRFEFENIPQEIKSKINYLKCGPYIDEQRTSDNKQYGINLSTLNQKIYKRGIDYED